MRTTQTERLLVERLSRLLDSEDGASVLALIQQLRRERTPPADRPSDDRPRHLGVWKLLEDGALERDGAMASEWRSWADVHRIPAKRRPRVVLIGESVARGYLYDPELTPAGVLQQHLDRALGGQGVEVVDLARMDLSLRGLVDLVERVDLLDPDAIVVWAGNNWTDLHRELSSGDYAVLAAALRDGGPVALRTAFLERCVRPRGESALDAMAATSTRLDVPVVCVVPEFNLLDWCEPDVTLHLAAPRGRWLEARVAAEAAWTSGRHEECLRLADEWTALSEGTSPAAHRLAGLALLETGRPGAARVRLESARDAACGVLVPQAPRCPRVVQDLMRCGGAERGFAVIDLPTVLGRERLPDRHLFLDYCHLTLRGIVLAAGAVAVEVTRLLGGGEAVCGEPAVSPPAPAVEATAHFMAAVHNAHYPQPGEIVDHHCLRAVGLWPDVGGLMLALLDAERRRAPAWMCRSFATLQRSRIVRRCLVADVDLRNKHSDVDLVSSIARALDRVGPDGAAQAMQTWVEEHGDPQRPVDLLDHWHRPASFRERVGDSFWPSTSYYRAFEPVSRFSLVRSEATGLELDVTCRVPESGGPRRTARVAVNGHPVAEVAVTGAWARHRVSIDGSLVRAGCNEVVIDWPPPAPGVERHLAGAARRLDRHELPCLLQVFGEIDRLVAARAATPGPAVTGREPAPERRSSSSTDLRRPGTPSRGPLHPALRAGYPSAVLAHPPQVGSLRSSAPDRQLGQPDTESLADCSTDVPETAES
jgi:hypothetical protein